MTKHSQVINVNRMDWWNWYRHKKLHYPFHRTAIGRRNIAYKPSSETTRVCFRVYSASSSVQLEFWRRPWENQDMWSDSTPLNSAYAARVFVAYISTLICIGYQVISRINWGKSFFSIYIWLHTPFDMYPVMFYFVWFWLDDEFWADSFDLFTCILLNCITGFGTNCSNMENESCAYFLIRRLSPFSLTQINFNPSRDK